MKKNKKKTARDRRVLIAALLVGALIMAGSTFAWFTSKDEVTNRLSASANYGVSIAEDFQPPEDWIPGQPVNKDVSAVNTGNVDAFVRMWLEGEMSVMKKDSTGTAVPASITAGLGYTVTEDGDTMKGLGFKYYNSGKYYKVLSTTERTNPALNGTNSAVGDNDYSEVKSVQAGGYLVYAPASAKWSYKTAQQMTMRVYDSGFNGYVTEAVPKDTVVGPSGSTGISKTIEGGAPCVIDSDTFVPQTPGLYIFRRTIDLNSSSNTADAFEYTGYVFDGTDYFALNYDDTDTKSDYVLPDGAVTAATSTAPQAEPLTYTLEPSMITLYSASETIVKNNGLTWAYNEGTDTDPAVLTATYNGGTADPTTTDDIIIKVTLDNIKKSTATGTESQQWTHIKTTDVTGINYIHTFYYNDDLEAGDSSAKLIDSLTLDPSVTQKAFIAFDFDLNVFLESVQVTVDENGNEKTTPVETGGIWATSPAAPSSGSISSASPAAAAAQAIAEIEKIAWS